MVKKKLRSKEEIKKCILLPDKDQLSETYSKCSAFQRYLNCWERLKAEGEEGGRDEMVR